MNPLFIFKLPFVLLYWVVITLRNVGYNTRCEWGVFKAHKLNVPVISVGNLTAGGSGKTPMVSALLTFFEKQQCYPVVLTRGYGRKGISKLIRLTKENIHSASAEAVGDEPLMLAKRHPQCAVHIGASRYQSAWLAMQWETPPVFVMDDGFQHRALQRDLNVLVVDSHSGLGNGYLLPAGPLRERITAAKRADAIVFSRANQQRASKPLSALKQYALKQGIPTFESTYQPQQLQSLDYAQTMPLAEIKQKQAACLCALGNPQSFYNTLVEAGAQLQARIQLPDHDPYHALTLRAVLKKVRANPNLLWLTTEKDAVKLRNGWPDDAPMLWVLVMEAHLEARFEGFLMDFFKQHQINSFQT